MMKFIWDAKYSLNLKTIDSQHQKFFEIINRIYPLARQKNINPQDILAVITELNQYAEKHLSYEEKCFQDYHYPDADSHLRAHHAFRQQIKEFFLLLSQPQTNISALAEQIADFSQNWLSAHILEVDHHYVSFFLTHDLN